jgi:ceramide glucosyltransferase
MLAIAVEVVTALLALSGVVYLILALWGVRDFIHSWGRRKLDTEFAPNVSILKPVKGVDPRMYEGLASHCRQEYAGKFEILFGVSSLDDPAVAEIARLMAEFPECAIRIIECRERLGTSGKVSNLIQMLPEAQFDYVLINDSDIRVGRRYLARVMACFADEHVGMVTAPYRGMTVEKGATLWAKLEAMGISTDFFPGVLTARMLERGIRFGLGSTLAMRREALAKAGGLEPLVECLGDDYEMGARIAAAGYCVELAPEVVETTVPQYGWRGFVEHQMRWYRTVRDSRKWGYAGLVSTYALPWAMVTCVASGFALWSFTLLSMAALARASVALSVGVGVLGDSQVLRDLWLLPLRDCVGMVFWLCGFAGDTIVWRGERFRLKDGRLSRVVGQG